MADQSLQWLAGPGGTTTDTKAITVSAGSTIVAWLTDGSTNSISGFGVSDGTAYSPATNGGAVDGSNFVAGEVFWLQNASAGTHTVIGTTGGSAAQIFLAEVLGPATGAHISDAAQFQGAPTTGANAVTSGNMTIATAVTILALSTDSSVVNAGNEPNVGTGFTTRLNGTGSIGSWRLESGSASTTSAATFTAIANDPHVTWAIAIANASGATSTTPRLIFVNP